MQESMDSNGPPLDTLQGPIGYKYLSLGPKMAATNPAVATVTQRRYFPLYKRLTVHFYETLTVHFYESFY